MIGRHGKLQYERHRPCDCSQLFLSLSLLLTGRPAQHPVPQLAATCLGHWVSDNLKSTFCQLVAALASPELKSCLLLEGDSCCHREQVLGMWLRPCGYWAARLLAGWRFWLSKEPRWSLMRPLLQSCPRGGCPESVRYSA